MASSAQKAPDVARNSELIELCPSAHLYLKPIARVSITVQVPVLHDSSGQLKSFTTWEIIEKLRQLSPGLLSPPTSMKVVRTTLEFVRFVAELESKADVKRAVTSLDSQFIKLSGFPQNLRVRASEAPFDCPRRHDWEAFFRDAKDMDETRPGERPDTVVLSGLPVRWFLNPASSSSNSKNSKFGHVSELPNSDNPDPDVLKKAFSMFGAIRLIDIPINDPVQNPDCLSSLYDAETSNSGTDTPTITSTNIASESTEIVGGFGKIGPDTISIVAKDLQVLQQSPERIFTNALGPINLGQRKSSTVSSGISPLTFTAYIQYMDYNGFSRAMDALLGQKLVYAPTGTKKISLSSSSSTDDGSKLYFTADIKVDFDRTKHLSKSAIRERDAKRSHLLIVAERKRTEARLAAQAEIERMRLLRDAQRKADERRCAEALAVQAEREARRAARAERKRALAIERCKQEKESLVKRKILVDEHRTLVAIRKAEGIRLMTYLLAKVKARHDLIVAKRRAARALKAEKAAAEAEACAKQVLSVSILSHSTQPNSKMCRPLPDSPKQKSPDSLETTDFAADDEQERFQQLLRKREEALRLSLLRKREEALRAKFFKRPGLDQHHDPSNTNSMHCI